MVNKRVSDSGAGTVLCVGGSGRSGSSLVACFLHRSGFPMGETFRGPGIGNRLGFFEDLEFLEFHKRVLARSRSHLYLPWRPIRPKESDVEEARAMIAARTERWPAWGWKDPRATHFMEFWAGLVPGLKFLILYRQPEAAIRSMLRQMGWRWKLFPPTLAARAWVHDNRMALAFSDRHPGQVMFMSIDHLQDMPEVWVERLGKFLSYPLTVDRFREIYRPREMNRGPKKEPLVDMLWSLSHKRWGGEIEQTYTALLDASRYDDQLPTERGQG